MSTITTDPCPPYATLRAARSPFTASVHSSMSTWPIDSLIITTKAYATNAVINGLLPASPATPPSSFSRRNGHVRKAYHDTFRNPQRRPNLSSPPIPTASGTRISCTSPTGIGAIELGIIPDPSARLRGLYAQPRYPRPEQKLQLDDIMSPTEANPDLRYQSLRNTIAALTNAEGLNATWRPLDVQMAMRRKVVVNSIINPITALLLYQR
ncbi:hypothetical protein A0H81_01220 [Grifola frondosa]|uniref:Ketopantoate reductase C-terminal domain-containing protein n=1 Tax=Grifola frondosa TaxID=5627 RepID=A0A1C7MRN7_GRIFR|nr:hypothetical protein A0H81_01220 [Grifola frondosa]